MVAGWFLLILPCLGHSWRPTTSTINPFGRAPRTISEWDVTWYSTTWLNDIYGNREDGCSGAEALIWNGPVRVLYMPDANKPAWLPQWLWGSLRAWLWSAWRNSTNELSR
jgi:hypothetical protein